MSSRSARARMLRTRRGAPITLALLIVALSGASPQAAAAAGGPGHFRGVVSARNANGAGLHARIFRAPRSARAAAASSSNLRYWGGPVMHSDANYVVFWEAGGYTTPASYKSTITSYFANVAAASGATSNDYSVSAQYSDSSGPIAYSATAGTQIIDTNPYPASGCAAAKGQPCLTDAQMESELGNVIAARGLPRGLGTLYYIFTPAGVATCFTSASTDCSSGGRSFDYCAYHSSFGSGTATTLYAVMPYADVSGCRSGQYPNGNAADQTLNVTSHENIEAITDPLGDAWFDSSGQEIGDKCGWNFGSALGGTSGALYNEQISSGRYYLQQEWSNASSNCVQRMSGGGGTSTPVAAFTFTPAGPTSGQSVSFNGSGSTDTGATITSYSWTFGDGATGSGLSVSHAYSTAGNYTATLTVSDSAGQTSSISHTVTVASTSSTPVAAFTFTPTSPLTGQGVSFNGSGSTDTGATITSYSWTFGDKSSGSGVTPSHVYLTAGTYTVKLIVTDSLGHTASVTHSITVTLGKKHG